MAIPTAYRYIRWSTEEQRDTKSLERQQAITQRIAERTGLPIKLLPPDEGLSATKAEHIARGSLGRFLQQVRANRIARGSVLCVEDIDRLERRGMLQTLLLVDSLCNAGIEIHTQGSRVTTPEDAELVLKAHTSRTEIKKKAERVADAWQRKRAAAETQGIYVGRPPGWINVRRDAKLRAIGYELDEEKACVVREIFKLAASGLGPQAIANKLNANRRPHVGYRAADAWYVSYIKRILRGRTTLGEVESVDGPLKVYPPAVSPELWHKAQRAHRVSGKPSAREKNLFRGLLWSGVDGSRMLHRDHGDYAYLVSADTMHKKARTPHRTRYDEENLVRMVEAFWSSKGIATSDEQEDATATARSDLAEAERVLKRWETIAESTEVAPAIVGKKLIEAEERLRRARYALEEAQVGAENRQPPASKDLKSAEGRKRYRQDLARVIEAIWIDDDDTCRVQFKGSPNAWWGRPADLAFYGDSAKIGVRGKTPDVLLGKSRGTTTLSLPRPKLPDRSLRRTKRH